MSAEIERAGRTGNNWSIDGTTESPNPTIRKK
jgi:hypothetical protein